jgi:hypothetical protein
MLVACSWITKERLGILRMFHFYLAYLEYPNSPISLFSDREIWLVQIFIELFAAALEEIMVIWCFTWRPYILTLIDQQFCGSYFRGAQPIHEKRELLHHAKSYTVASMHVLVIVIESNLDYPDSLKS